MEWKWEIDGQVIEAVHSQGAFYALILAMS